MNKQQTLIMNFKHFNNLQYAQTFTRNNINLNIRRNFASGIRKRVAYCFVSRHFYSPSSIYAFKFLIF